MSTRSIILPLFFGLFFSGVLSAQQDHRDAEKQQQKEAVKLTEAQMAFSNLPEARRIDFAKMIIEANRYFSQKRIFEAMEQIYQSRNIFKDSPEAWNMMGSCYVELRDWKKATDCFQEAMRLAPGDFAVTFNLAEMDYVQRRWADCITKLETVCKLLPKDEMATRRIAEFKILLCHIGLGKMDEAKKLAEKYDPISDDSPYYYFANAAVKYAEKKVEDAEAWTIRVAKIFPREATVAWTDSLIEFGFVESFYGGAAMKAEGE